MAQKIRRFKFSFFHPISFSFLIAFWFNHFSPAFGFPVIGEIESMYRKRVSLRILEIPTGSDTVPLKVGQRVSFMLPKFDKKLQKGKEPFGFGSIIEADIEGNVATEYASASETLDPEEKVANSSDHVMIWVANRVEKVKNPRKYKPSEAKGGKKGRHKKREPKEPPKIWTQEETVKGQVILKNLRIFIKEERLKPKDKGLDVVDDEWYEKLKPYSGQKIVVSGTTHRLSAASGTIEIKNLMKIYPK
ncbi:hypothetical protein HYY75_07560 [bacterium]|nr:hypothetical protein [bacterium]